MAIKEVIKGSTVLASLYVWTYKFFVRILSFFVKQNPRLVIFSSFSGRQYSDSPRAIFELLKANPGTRDYEFVWLMNDASTVIEGANVVEFGSLKHTVLLVKAKFWVSNASIERFVPIDFLDNVYLNTWHGTPWKVIGPLEKGISPLVRNWYLNVDFDYLTVNTPYDDELFSEIFPKAKNIMRIGLPRNYELVTGMQGAPKLNLDASRQTILYAPTFRDYQYDVENSPYLSETQIGKLAEKYNVLVRTHYNDDISVDIKSVFDANGVSLNEAFIAADVLITDYSSLMFDFAILNKKIITYTLDYAKYKETRGLFFEVSELPFNNVNSFSELEILLDKNDNYKSESNGKFLPYHDVLVGENEILTIFEGEA